MRQTRCILNRVGAADSCICSKSTSPREGFSPRIFLSLGSWLLVSLASAHAQGGNPAPAAIDKKVPVIELSGNGFQRGFQHGRQLKAEIAAVLLKRKENAKLQNVKDLDLLIEEFLNAVDFEPAIKKWTPELLAEVRGIAAGAGQPFRLMFAFQLGDEFWVYLDKLENIKLHSCSSIGVAAGAGRPATIAQNMDIENFLNGHQVLLHAAATKNEPEQYILSCPGLIGLTGMNAKGIGICANSLIELQASPRGLPVAFVVRGMLSKSNGPDALAFIKKVPHASGQNYIIGVGDNVYDFEASSGQVVPFVPQGAANGVVYHTNHALANHDVKDWYKEYHQKIITGVIKKRNTVVRFASLQARLNGAAADITPDVIKAALRSKDHDTHPVCAPIKEGDPIFTFSSVFFALGGKRSVQLTYGPPDEAEYHEHFFKEQ